MMVDKQYVVIKDMSAGNETIGETWQETKVFKGEHTLPDVMQWACPGAFWESHQEIASFKRVQITIAHPTLEGE